MKRGTFILTEQDESRKISQGRLSHSIHNEMVMNTSAIVSLSRAHFIPRGSIIFKYFKTPTTNPLKWRCYLPNHPVICLQISSESVSQVGNTGPRGQCKASILFVIGGGDLVEWQAFWEKDERNVCSPLYFTLLILCESKVWTAVIRSSNLVTG